MEILTSEKSIKCKNCGKIFFDYIVNHRIYCSHKCANIASAPIRRRRIIFKCEVCGSEISIIKSTLKFRKKVRYCSYKCLSIGMKQKNKWTEKECLECKNRFEILKSRTKRKFCSLICSKRWRIKYPPNKRNGYWMENGYKVLYVQNGNGIKEHIQIMEESIGRKILSNEVVHHINEIKDDNRIENLQLMTRGEHSSYHRLKNKREGKHLFGGYNNN